MRNLMILFFVLFTNVAGFAVEEVCGGGIGVESVCVEADFDGGHIDVFQGFAEVEVVVRDNEEYLGSVLVVDESGEEVFLETFVGDATIIISIEEFSAGGYILIAKAGTTMKIINFRVK